MFDVLEQMSSRPDPFQFYTAEDLWTDDHTSKKMLEYHLNEAIDLSSRNAKFIAHSANWIVSKFGLGSGASVADFGCGPGLYTSLFASVGAKVSGIDFSARSIQYAREAAQQKGLEIDYFDENYLEFETEERFDLITMIFCDFCALSPSQRETLLAKFHEFLKPGGSVLLDVHSQKMFDDRTEAAVYERNQLDHFWSAEDYFGFLNTFKYENEKVTLDKYTIIKKAGTRVVYNWLQYFTRDSLREELEKNGFQATEFYSDVAGSAFSLNSPDIAVVARKM